MKNKIDIINIVRTSYDDERVIIKVYESCNLNEFLLFDTTYDENGIISNKERHLMVFPLLNVEPGQFVWVYTKNGIQGQHNNTSGTITHKLYWGLGHSIWNNKGDKAYLVHYDNWMAKESE